MSAAMPRSCVTEPLIRVTPESSGDRSSGTNPHLNTPSRIRVQRALRLVAGFGALRRDQLEALLLAGEPLTPRSKRVVAHRIVAELRARGTVRSAALAGGDGSGSVGYVLTAAGQRVYAASDASYPRRRASRELSVALLDHAIALADIAVAFRNAALRAIDVALVWESDWEAVARLGSTAAIPDAFVTVERGKWRTRAFIEADRSTEWNRAFAGKVRRYIDLYHRDTWRGAIATWPLVLTVTLSEVRAQSLARVTQRVVDAEGGSRIARAFRFASLEELSRRGPFEPIWYVGDGAGRLAIPELEPPISAPRDRVENLAADPSGLDSTAVSLRLPEEESHHGFLNNRTGMAS